MWITKFLIVIAVVLVLGEVLGSLGLFKGTTLGTPKVTAGSLARFAAHAGALVLLLLMGRRLAHQLLAVGGGMARLADPVMALVTLVVTASAYLVIIKFSAPFMSSGIKVMVNWTFILGILAAAVWLVWALFQNSEAVMQAVATLARPKLD